MKPNMHDNFKLLEERVLDSLEKTDLERIKYHLERIKTPTITTGVGGSSVVSNYAAKVLSTKNGIIAEHQEPRDMLYKSLNGYSNVLACSYGGKNYGVKTSFNNDLNRYLLSRNESTEEGVNNLTYNATIPDEDSFISLAATLMPMSIMLAYYNDNDISVIKEILKTAKEYKIDMDKVYEILTGYDTTTASTYLESTLAEAGLASPVIHDKYSLCHGRTTLSYHHDNSLIHLNRNTELDKLYQEELPQYYNAIITLDSKYEDPILDDFYLTYQAMILSKQMAEQTGRDLSRMDYSPVVKKLYRYSGEM
ncbi:MAG: hypothetical protein IJA30_06610 [Bacilli bacterium]|nr:hypothetical protein [Bacilli bacterium]